MYIAMNRFKVKSEEEDTFVDIWRNRDSHLQEVPGFVRFHLLKGASQQGFTLFSSFTEWASEQAFVDWTHSQAFKDGHAHAGKKPHGFYLGPPELECFEVIL